MSIGTNTKSPKSENHPQIAKMTLLPLMEIPSGQRRRSLPLSPWTINVSRSFMRTLLHSKAEASGLRDFNSANDWLRLVQKKPKSSSGCDTRRK